MKKIDFHTHTYHSYDSNMKPSKILAIAKKKGLDAIVINDHDTIAGGLECKKINPYIDLEVIVGSEIKTSAGDITGIFLKNEIISKDPVVVCKEIHSQGGLTILNHPYVDHDLDQIDFSKIDIIEGYNGRCTQRQNEQAVQLAVLHKKPYIAGSDAHSYSEIGTSYCFTCDIRSLTYTDHHQYHTGFLGIWKSQLTKFKKKKDWIMFAKLIVGAPLMYSRYLRN